MSDDQLPSEYKPFSFEQDVVTFDLSGCGNSAPSAIKQIFPEQYLGDLFLVFGLFGTPERNVLRFPYEVLAQNAVVLVMGAINHIYDRLGKDAVVDVYIVPPQGLRDFPPHPDGYFFNVSSAPDKQWLYTHIERETEDHMPARRADAQGLVQALKNMVS
ncbi:MAG: hypothetical protein H6868_04960 [Rhodospirillales bacterium]|nr:hypothetical protein [Rhodospirillales bacterium]